MIDSLLVPRRQLRLGPLLAQGGEGRVYELSGRPEQVYKAYRVPQPTAGLAELVGWSASLDPSAATRVQASTAWPVSVVVEGSATEAGTGKGDPRAAVGLLLPRAPRRFSLRHRDGRPHLASLSYLTADPDRRSSAYGIDLPPAMSPERLGLVYALARLIEGFESARPGVVHGDLSAKNVLWSLARGPEVFVLDCDNGERYSASRALGPPERRRAMTPNWDDPAIAPGANPGSASDRYSLALIFLRVCGAAHYPIQKRQKAGEVLGLQVGVPASARRVRSLAAGAPLWDLCARGLAVADPVSRPPAAAWVAALETVIVELGVPRILDAVWAAQGRSPVSPVGVSPVAVSPVAALDTPPVGVTVEPVRLPARTERGKGRPAVTAVAAAAPIGWTAVRSRNGGISPRPASGSGFGPAAGVAPGPGGAAGSRGPSALSQLRSVVAAVVSWIVEEHRRTIRYLRMPERRRRGLWRILWCVAVDFVTACVVLFLVAMIASPFLGV